MTKHLARFLSCLFIYFWLHPYIHFSIFFTSLLNQEVKLLGIQIFVARVSWPKIGRITQAYYLSQLPLLVWIVQPKQTRSSDTDIFFQHISSYLLLTIYGSCFFTCQLTANTVINCSSCKLTFIEVHNWSTILIYLHFKYLCVLLLFMSTPLYFECKYCTY